jgi:RES domain-containing protein
VTLLTAWRLVKTRFLHNAFDGDGARLYGGRWNSPGVPVVYTSATASLAVLELFANIQRSELLVSYSLLSCSFDETLVSQVRTTDLPMHLRQSPAPAELQAIGDEWLQSGRSAVLQVPSSIIEHESNYLLNPTHRGFKRIKQSTPEPFTFDLRLIKLSRRLTFLRSPSARPQRARRAARRVARSAEATGQRTATRRLL